MHAEKPIWRSRIDSDYCQHGVACDVHCCRCHSGFTFDHMDHDIDCLYYQIDIVGGWIDG